MATKTYRAGTMREALARVRLDLGGGAVILGTREVRRRRLFGLGTRPLIEVTAADGLPEIAAVEASPLQAQFGARLSELHAMVARLSDQGRFEHWLPDLTAELAAAYARLLEADVPELLARRLARLAAERLAPEDLGRDDRATEAVLEVMEGCVAVAPPIGVVPGTRRVVALVGPTGVGKTTTVAKLAANLKLAQGFRPGLVTVDTYRIAAVEQLRTYAEIIGLPLAVANAPADMARALDELGDVDVVLIDTAGRSPRDEVKIRELADFLAAARPDETHLVLSAAAGERSLRAALGRFAVARPDRIILTKLDEADRLGEVFGVLAGADRPLSYLTTGQAVPDDIEGADRSRLARLVLGLEAVV